MAELYCIRTFMKLKVLEAIPKEGAISFPELSKGTGVQESLLGRQRNTAMLVMARRWKPLC